jgi:hypothetical protein
MKIEHAEPAMSSKKYTPTIDKQEFDARAPALRAALKRKYDASKSDADRPKPNPATKGAFDHVPDLDSKTVARWSSTVKDHLGCRLDPKLIHKGGYDSFDAFWDNVAPKLRASCPDAAPAEVSAVLGAAR